MPALKRLRQKDHEFEASMDNTMRLYLINKRERQRERERERERNL
jgi:hypothetical protein